MIGWSTKQEVIWLAASAAAMSALVVRCAREIKVQGETKEENKETQKGEQSKMDFSPNDEQRNG